MKTTLLRMPRPLWYSAALFLLFNGALFAWLLIKPGTHDQFTAVNNLAQTIGLLLAVFLCLVGVGKPWRRDASRSDHVSPARMSQRWVPILIGLGILSEAIGQAIFTYYGQILHQTAPFPSWADAGFLIAYPFLLLGILLLPTRPLSGAARSRVLLDGLMIMTAVVTFSWYFILGPTMLQAGGTAFAKIVESAYPFADLVLIFCLLLLSSRSIDPVLQPVVRLLSLSLAIILITDSVFDYQSLQGTYPTGGLVDMGWIVGYMLAGLAVQFMSLSGARLRTSTKLAANEAVSRQAISDIPSMWRSLQPYALIPAVGVLVIYILRTGGSGPLERGVYLGGIVLIGLVLLRQIFAIRETSVYAKRTQQLNEELVTTHEELHENNVALSEANTRLQALATTDPLTGLPNHRSLVAALDREIERARRYHRSCSVFFLDIDHFKALNDGYGHSAGDVVLHEFASTIQATLRSIDTIGRWGGEEFLVIMPDTDREGAPIAAERVRAAVAAHIFAIGGGARLTCSLGIAMYPADADERDSLVTMADQAMYAAKRLGRNQVRTANDSAVLALGTEVGRPGSREDIALAGTVEALAALVEARDHYTGQHTRRVANLTLQLALALGIDASEAHMISLGARLHDIGKVGIPDAILQKPARLTKEEWDLIRRHPEIGADVISRVPSLRAVASAVRAHHERWDGGGYPDKLAGEAIPLSARIIAVVDSYEAMTTDRPYQKARDTALAIAELRRCAGTQFDPTVVKALESVLAMSGARAEIAGVA